MPLNELNPEMKSSSVCQRVELSLMYKLHICLQCELDIHPVVLVHVYLHYSGT